MRALEPAEVAPALARAAAFAQRHEIRLGIQVSPEHLHSDLLAALDARGWEEQWPTVVMTGPPGGGSRLPELVIEDHASRAWLVAWRACEGRSDVEAHAKTVFALLRGRAWFARLGEAAVAIAVPSDGLLGLFCIAVAPEQRRTGLGRAIITALCGRAPEAVPYLQVEARNAPAIALYRQLGFTEAYRYRHRVAPGSGGPEARTQTRGPDEG